MERPIWLLVCVVWCCCSRPLSEAKHPDQQALVVRVLDNNESPVLHASRGSYLQIEIVLQNVFGEARWVNKRLLFNSSAVAAPFREVWMRGIKPNQKLIEFHCVVNGPLPGAEDYMVMNPGDKIRVTRSLECIDLDVAGPYFLTVRYKDGNYDVPPAPGAIKHLSEGLESAVVRLVLDH